MGAALGKSLGNRLDAARRRGFFGRDRELGAFRDLLDPDTAPQILLLHGASGVGKTALMHQYAWLAGEAGRPVVRLDGHELAAPTVRAIAAVRGGDDPVTALAATHGLVLLVDTMERLAPLEGWLRRELIPALAADAVVVIAGRDRPSPVWRADPGWRELVEIVPLGNLGSDDSRRLLAARGVPEDERDAAVRLTRGHPLALALVADVSARRGLSPLSEQEVMGALLRGFVDTVPGPAQKQALEACAQVLSVTEPLLAALLGLDDAGQLFAWLRDLSIVEQGARGLFPHDLARDALAAELRWRDPEGYARIRRRAAAYYRRRFEEAVDLATRQSILLDYVYLHRETSVLGPFVAGYVDTEALTADRPTGKERDLLVSWVHRHEGADAARLCERWLDAQPDSVTLVRGPEGEPVGFVQVIRLDGDAPRVSGDPALPGEVPDGGTRMVRFWMDAERYQEPSPVQLFITAHVFRTFLDADGPARTLLTFADPEPWLDACAHLDFHRDPAADFAVGGRTYAVFLHDWRVTPPLAWVAQLAARDALASPGAARRPLGEEEFAAAVRAALRAYGKADGLRDSPLLRACLLGEDGTDDPVAGLRKVFEETAAVLAASPRDVKSHRALHHTFLRPAATQADAADLLGLPATTYRRHLVAAEARFVELLWRRELDARAQNARAQNSPSDRM